MNTLFIECKMGIAGDMLTAALISLFDDVKKKEKELNEIGIPNVEFVLEDSTKCGVVGKHMRVLVKGQEEPDSEEEHHNAHEYEHEHEGHLLQRFECFVEVLDKIDLGSSSKVIDYCFLAFF